MSISEIGGKMVTNYQVRKKMKRRWERYNYGEQVGNTGTNIIMRLIKWEEDKKMEIVGDMGINTNKQD